LYHLYRQLFNVKYPIKSKDTEYNYALIKYKYDMKEKWIVICKYIQHNNFTFIFYRPQNKFLSYSELFIIKGKNMQIQEHLTFNYNNVITKRHSFYVKICNTI
jgi:hypothetical protein